MTTPPKLDELGFYTLAGAPKSTRDMLDELRVAEELALGTAFISERFNIKEAVTQCGAAGAVTDNIRIVTAATNHNTRHPMVTASFASTMLELLTSPRDDAERLLTLSALKTVLGKSSVPHPFTKESLRY